MSIKLDDVAYFHFGTSSPATGAATEADAIPTITVEEDGVALAYSPTVSTVTTGLYRITCACSVGNGFEIGKRYSVYAQATVGGIAGRDSIAEFPVNENDIDSSLDVGSIQNDVINAGTFDTGAITSDAIAANAITSSEAPALANLDVAVSTRAAPGDAMDITATGAALVIDEIVEGTYSVREMLRMMAAALLGKVSGGGTVTVTFRDTGDTKNRIVATVDANGNRTAVVLDEA